MDLQNKRLIDVAVSSAFGAIRASLPPWFTDAGTLTYFLAIGSACLLSLQDLFSGLNERIRM